MACWRRSAPRDLVPCLRARTLTRRLAVPTVPAVQEAADFDYSREGGYAAYDEQSWEPYEAEPQQWSSST